MRGRDQVGQSLLEPSLYWEPMIPFIQYVVMFLLLMGAMVYGAWVTFGWWAGILVALAIIGIVIMVVTISRSTSPGISAKEAMRKEGLKRKRACPEWRKFNDKQDPLCSQCGHRF